MRSLLIWLALCYSTLTAAQQLDLSVPELIVPSTLTEWKARRKEIRETLLAALGNLPEAGLPVVSITSREDKGLYVLENFIFRNGAGADVPGYLLIPKDGKEKHPAIYYCHWHGGNYDLGKSEIFTTHHTPEIPAEALTARGFVVMAIDTYGFGARSGSGPGGPTEKGSAEELTTSKYELWMGRSLWAMIVRDDQMALEYLFSRPEVDAKNVAVTGISMGATRSWWLMALDDRIKTGVAVGCLTRYQNLISEQKLKYHGIYYFVPGILKHFDTEAIISLIAPRPVLFMTGDEDPGSPVQGIVAIESAVKPAYALYRAEEKFRNIIYPKTGHVYTPAMWKNMLDWMQTELK